MVIEDSLVKRVAGRDVVLLVDDDSAVRRSLQLLLRANGYDVLAYSAASDLLADPAARAATCLVADYLMPDIDGLELLQQLRGTGWTRPAILVTGAASNDLARRAQAQGFERIVEKPLQPRLILEAIAQATASRPTADLR